MGWSLSLHGSWALLAFCAIIFLTFDKDMQQSLAISKLTFQISITYVKVQEGNFLQDKIKREYKQTIACKYGRDNRLGGYKFNGRF